MHHGFRRPGGRDNILPMDNEPLPMNEAIARAIGDRSQESIAHALGLSQPSISRWLRGASVPGNDELRRLEIACGRPVGFILRAAGYVEPERSIEDVIRNHPGLDEVGREMLLAMLPVLLAKPAKLGIVS